MDILANIERELWKCECENNVKIRTIECIGNIQIRLTSIVNDLIFQPFSSKSLSALCHMRIVYEGVSYFDEIVTGILAIYGAKDLTFDIPIIVKLLNSYFFHLYSKFQNKSRKFDDDRSSQKWINEFPKNGSTKTNIFDNN